MYAILSDNLAVGCYIHWKTFQSPASFIQPIKQGNINLNSV